MPGKGIKYGINNYFCVISKQGNFLDLFMFKVFLDLRLKVHKYRPLGLKEKSY